MTELAWASLSSVCARIKSGELSAREVTEAQLERIEAVDPALHAYVMVLGERALERARLLDEARAHGKPLGLLHGVPVAVKDLFFMEGLPTASGTRVMADFVPEETATVVARLEAAGAVIIGKTQLTEGAYGVHHPDVVAPLNPWDPARWPGVSSSGSAVAVAAGLCYGALGSDTGGSIRFPAASCGIVGLKPTYGRVSRHGAFPLAESLDHVGPMARSVADAARLLQVMAGADPHDASTLPDPVPNYGAEPGGSIQGLTVGIDRAYAGDGVEAPVRAGVESAARLLTGLGAEIREVLVPAGYRELAEHWGITCAVECAEAHAAWYPSRRSEYGPVLAELIELGRNPPPGAYAHLEEVRRRFRAELDALFQQVDVLLAPNMPYLPPLTEEVLTLGSDPERANGLTFTAPFDYSGHPTLSLPVGLTPDRLPVTVQLIGPHLNEGLLVRTGAAMEQALGFSEHPIP